MANKKRWATQVEVEELLSINAKDLNQLKSQGSLKAGTHWVYLIGHPGSLIGWDIDAIEIWQRDQTRTIEENRLKAGSMFPLAESTESQKLRVINGGV